MLSRAGIAVLLFVLCSCRTSAPDPGTRLDALFSDLHQRGLFDGAVVVGRGDQIVWEKGFGFANVLREFGLPREALGWSLFSFNLGVEIGQLAVVLAVATVLTAIRRRSELLGARVAIAGSVVVIAAGTYWFVQRVFFPTGA